MRSLFRFALLCFLFSLFSCDVTDSNNTEDKSKVEKLTESTLTLTNGQEETITVSLVANTFYNLVIPGQRETSQLEIAVTAPSGSVQYITFDPFFQAKESGDYTIKFTWTGTEELSTTVTINSVAIPTEIYGTWFLTKEKETEAGAVISETSFSTVAESNFIIVNTPLYCFEYELEGDTILVDTALFEEWGSDLLYMSIQNGALVYDENGIDEGVSWSRYECYKPYSGQLPPQEWLDKVDDDNDKDDDEDYSQFIGTWFLSMKIDTEDDAIIHDAEYSSAGDSYRILEITNTACIDHQYENFEIISDTMPLIAMKNNIGELMIVNGIIISTDQGIENNIQWTETETYRPYSGQIPPQEWLDDIDDKDKDKPVTGITTTIIDTQTVSVPEGSSVTVSFTIEAGQAFSVISDNSDMYESNLKDPDGNFIESPFCPGTVAQSSGIYSVEISNEGTGAASTKVYVFNVTIPQKMQGAWYIAKIYENESGEEYIDEFNSASESIEIDIFTSKTLTVLSQPAYKDETTIGSYWGIGCPVYGDEIKTFFRGDTLVISEEDEWEGFNDVYEYSFLPYDGGTDFPDGWNDQSQSRRNRGKRKRR